ncbi:MAG: hypothetical protein KME05_19790 [Gloeocapsa sp. UFS-A4-WI-NPMV-4B04]|nr:hypothetical protein [Gloeocapsa sp. UFS-A4-WI-NPMV-4B04]
MFDLSPCLSPTRSTRIRCDRTLEDGRKRYRTPAPKLAVHLSWYYLKCSDSKFKNFKSYAVEMCHAERNAV